MGKLGSMGLKKDTPDPRDKNFVSLDNKLAGIYGWFGTSPVKVDLRRTITPIRNQGFLGSCTGHAIGALAEALDLQLENQENSLSPLFIYYLERKIEGSIEEDAGAMLRTGMKVLSTYGVCTENEWPYDAATFKDPPPALVMNSALQHRVTSYYRVANFSQLKRALAYSNPVVMGIAVYESFEKASVDGIVPMPATKEELLGGHAVLAVGYNVEKNCVVVKNSWGPEWGDKGFFYLPIDYFDPRLSYVWDMWTANY